MKYTLVTWPESQLLLNQDWLDECILANDIQGHDEIISPAYFVPDNRYLELVVKTSIEGLNLTVDSG